MRTLAGSCLLLAALGAGCIAMDKPTSERDRAKAELARQRELFEQSGPTSYVVTEQQGCFCAPETTDAMRVTVTAGSVTSAVYAADGKAVPANVKSGVKTVAQVFDLIEQALDDGHTTISVTYDPVGHYPSTMQTSVPDALDSGFSVSLTNLDPRPASAASCKSLEDRARTAVQSTIEANVACKADSDCTRVSFSASCFASCYAVMAKNGAAALTATQDQVEATQCAEYHDAGCTLIVPPCAPPLRDPVCSAGGVCVNAP